MKQRIFVVLSLCISAMTVATAARTQESFTVMLDWFVNPDHAPLFVALELGYFADAGLNVNFIAPADPNDPPKMVAAERADLAVSYQPQLYLLVESGLPLVRVGTLVATPLNSLVVLADGPVQTIADLSGRRIGFSVGGFQDIFLKAMLGQHGLTLEDVELINVNFSLSPALISGEVDAVIGAFRNFELNQMDIVGRPGRAFFVEEEGVPAYDELILVAHASRVGDSRLRAFFNALERGVQYLINHPGESWELFVRGRPDLDDELNRRAWTDTLPRFALRPQALDISRYARFGTFLHDQGLIQSVPPVNAIALQLP